MTLVAESPAPGVVTTLEQLTPRERDVLELIAAGLSNVEIAARLYLSINSVKTYIRAAYRKMGVERRPQAMIWAYQHGFGTDLVEAS